MKTSCLSLILKNSLSSLISLFKSWFCTSACSSSFDRSSFSMSHWSWLISTYRCQCRVRKRENKAVSVCARERECVWVCVRERKFVCVYERERERCRDNESEWAKHERKGKARVCEREINMMILSSWVELTIFVICEKLLDKTSNYS